VERDLRQAVFLDRDGVLNETIRVDGVSVPPRTVDEFRLIDGVIDAVNQFRAAGFLLFVVTNQPDVARGIQTAAIIERLHEKLRSLLTIDEIFACFHDDGDACDCRKPKPGMLTEAIQRYGVDVSRSFMVGDRWRDITAGRLAGCTTVLVGPDWEAPMPDAPDLRARDLREAAELICQSQSHVRRRTGA
jgi:D-glycero-D-manno-heptose 1,7-bisphosphate phosphatase